MTFFFGLDGSGSEPFRVSCRFLLRRSARRSGSVGSTLRKWVRQAQVDAGHSPGLTTAVQQRIKQFEREIRDLKEANEIPKAASMFLVRTIVRSSAGSRIFLSRRFVGAVGRSLPCAVIPDSMTSLPDRAQVSSTRPHSDLSVNSMHRP